MSPLYKNGPQDDVNNYRPISVLPVLSKVIEKHVHHIYSNCPENVKSITVPKIGLSDHFAVFFTCKMHNSTTKNNHYTISCKSFKDFDEGKFINDLQSMLWV